jgi:signal transduction histidine kinase
VAPILVKGSTWGVIFAGSSLKHPLPSDTEARLASVTALVGTAIANAESRAGLARLAEEQAALQRVATLVARGAPAEELFGAVTGEAGALLGAHLAGMGSYQSDDTVTVLATWAAEGEQHPLDPGPWPLEGGDLASMIRKTGRSVRIEDYHNVPGRIAEFVREELGICSSVASPIVVEGRLWGTLFLHSKHTHQPLPLDTESRLAAFTELVATAIANADGRAGLTRLANEQAALRRIATLVARGAPADELFSAVPEETGLLLQVGQATMIRYGSDGTSTIVTNWRRTGEAVPPIGARERLGGNNLTTIISQTRRPARMDSYADASGAPGVAARGAGFRSAAGAPVSVQGRLWGALIVSSVDEHRLPLDTEARLASFTELVATAIANAESFAELTASRARVVAAADETRRRIERDLHDGAQQRLVSLGLAVQAAKAVVPPGLGDLEGELAHVGEGLANVLDDLQEMARGIHPAILAKGGLGSALRTLARRSSVPVELDVRTAERLPEQVEVAAYYVVSEALTNAAKHARASVVHVDIEAAGQALRLRVRDDGAGGADPVRGTGLIGLKDRVEALGGTITVHSPAGAGTSLDVELPVVG